MKLVIKAIKFNDSIGRRRVRIYIEHVEGPLTYMPFSDHEDNKLRPIVNGVFENKEGWDGRAYTSMAEFRVTNEEEIDKIVEKVVANYRKVMKNIWEGEKIYEFEI